MLYFDRIDVFEGIDVNKSTALLECIVCHYRYCLDKWFKFQTDAYNMIWSRSINNVVNFNDIAILNIRGVDERCIINGISNKEAVDLQQNADWNKTN